MIEFVGSSRGLTVYLVALRDILAEEELSFNYNTTEYDLINQSCDFRCFCRSRGCLGEIMGFRYLYLEQKLALEGLLSPFLKRKLQEELSSSIMRTPGR